MRLARGFGVNEFEAMSPEEEDSIMDSVELAFRVARAPGGRGASWVYSNPSRASNEVEGSGPFADCRGLGIMSTFGLISSSLEYRRGLRSCDCPLSPSSLDKSSLSSNIWVPSEPFDIVRARTALGSNLDERLGDGGLTAKGFDPS